LRHISNNLTYFSSFTEELYYGYASYAISAHLAAAAEGVTFAPKLGAITVGNDDSAFSAVERIFVTANGPTGAENPQRQGLNSALMDGRSDR
jgi:hypothetical protein